MNQRDEEIRARNVCAIVTAKGETIIIDPDDVKRLSKHTWHVDSRGYAAAYIGGKIERMHRYLLNPGAEYHVDHINGNRLDNRRSNLRRATPSQNSMNRMTILSSTGVMGVYRHDGKFVAQIEVEKRSVHLGVFLNVDDAAKARRAAELHYFGEFAPIRTGGQHEPR